MDRHGHDEFLAVLSYRQDTGALMSAVSSGGQCDGRAHDTCLKQHASG